MLHSLLEDAKKSVEQFNRETQCKYEILYGMKNTDDLYRNLEESSYIPSKIYICHIYTIIFESTNTKLFDPYII